MESSELTEGMPAYCSPMIRFRKSSFWAMLKACWRTKTKSGLKDLMGQETRKLRGEECSSVGNTCDKWEKKKKRVLCFMARLCPHTMKKNVLLNITQLFRMNRSRHRSIIFLNWMNPRKCRFPFSVYFFERFHFDWKLSGLNKFLDNFYRKLRGIIYMLRLIGCYIYFLLEF